MLATYENHYRKHSKGSPGGTNIRPYFFQIQLLALTPKIICILTSKMVIFCEFICVLLKESTDISNCFFSNFL